MYNILKIVDLMGKIGYTFVTKFSALLLFSRVNHVTKLMLLYIIFKNPFLLLFCLKKKMKSTHVHLGDFSDLYTLHQRMIKLIKKNVTIFST